MYSFIVSKTLTVFLEFSSAIRVKSYGVYEISHDFSWENLLTSSKFVVTLLINLNYLDLFLILLSTMVEANLREF